MKPPTIFISYSHKDHEYKEELLMRLKVISRHSAVDEWHDENMMAGDDIDQTILKKLNEANIVCLLISPNFIASDYCFEKEMKAALTNVENKGVRIVSIIIRVTPDLNNYEFSKFLVLPKNAQSLEEVGSEDIFWANVEKGLREVINTFSSSLPQQQKKHKTIFERAKSKIRTVLNSDSPVLSEAGEPMDSDNADLQMQISGSQPSLEEQQKQANIIFDLVVIKITPYLKANQLLEQSLETALNCSGDSIKTLCQLAQSKDNSSGKPHKSNVCEAMGKLTRATSETLKEMVATRQPGVKLVCQNANTALNWLSLFSVDEQWLCLHRHLFTEDKISTPIFISAESKFSADYGLAALQKKQPPAQQLTGLFDPVNQDVVDIDVQLETGPGEDAFLEEIKQALWNLAFPVPNNAKRGSDSDFQPPPEFGRGANTKPNQQLNGEIISLRDGLGRDHYCMTQSIASLDQSSLENKCFAQLLEDLPGLRVIVFQSNHRNVLLVLESDIISRLRTMQELIKEYHNHEHS